jgi:hypothetical protein
MSKACLPEVQSQGMRKELIVLLLLLLALAFTPGCKKAPAAKPISFGIFEVIDCGSSPKPPWPVEGSAVEKYCLGPKAIVTAGDVRSAYAGENDRYHLPHMILNFGNAGAERLRETTQRLTMEQQTRGVQGRLAIMIDGKIVAAPAIHGVFSDSVVIDGISQTKAEEWAASLNASR